MFISLETKPRREKICLNVDRISSFTPLRGGGSLIMLSDGFECEVTEEYDRLLFMLCPESGTERKNAQNPD